MISIEEQNIFAYNIFPNIYTYISEYSFLKIISYLLLNISMNNYDKMQLT